MFRLTSYQISHCVTFVTKSVYTFFILDITFCNICNKKCLHLLYIRYHIVQHLLQKMFTLTLYQLSHSAAFVTKSVFTYLTLYITLCSICRRKMFTLTSYWISHCVAFVTKSVYTYFILDITLCNKKYYTIFILDITLCSICNKKCLHLLYILNHIVQHLQQKVFILTLYYISHCVTKSITPSLYQISHCVTFVTKSVYTYFIFDITLCSICSKKCLHFLYIRYHIVLHL